MQISFFRTSVLLAVFFLLLNTSLLSSIITFDKIFEGYKISKIFEADTEGGYILIGYKNGNPIFLRTNEYGETIYEKEYDFETNMIVGPTAIRCNFDTENTFITLAIKDFDDGSKDVFLIKFNSSGDTLWTRSMDHNFIDYPSDILEIQNNEFLMTFFHGEEHFAEDFDPVLTKLDSLGNIVWLREYDSEYRDSSVKIIPSSDGNYFMTLIRGGFMHSHGEILKINSVGDTLFTKRIISDLSVALMDNIGASDHENYITSGSYGINNGVGFSSGEIFVTKYDNEGNFLWDFFYGDGSQYGASGTKIIATEDYGYLVGGFTNSNPFSGQVKEAIIIKLDESGNMLWNKLFPIPGVGTRFKNLLQTSDGGYICTINIENGSQRIIKLDENGNVDIDNNNYELAITNYELKQNYPNPFNPTTRINYELGSKLTTRGFNNYELAKIVIYNAMGQEVWVSNPLSLNTNHCLFDGSKYNSGVYYYSLVVDDIKLSTKKMILTK